MSSIAWPALTPLLLSAWALVIGAWDVSRRRIPNALSLGAWPVAALPLVLSGHTWWGAAWQPTLWTTAAALLAGLPAYALGKLGAGDVKLMVAMALLTSPMVFAVSYATAGLLALCLLGLHALRLQGTLDAHPMLQRLASRLLDARSAKSASTAHAPHVKMPFGALLCAGLIVAMFTKV